MVTNFISLLLIINFCIQILGMKQQKSHARIHRVILELRQKSNHNESNQIQSINQKLIQNCRRSGTTTLQNSQILSQSQASSILLPESQFKKQGQSNFYKISNVISSESLCSQKEESEIYKRSIKTARPVSRRKVTSKDKYSKTVSEKQQAFKIDVKKSEVFEQLQILDPQYFFLEKEDQSKKENQAQFQQGKNIKAFWAKQHIFVSLFPIQYTECIVYHHPNILPVYGQVMLNKKRFVVSNEYKNSSLKDLIRQFGPFQQSLCKKYLYQIVCGVEQMHSRKTAHNRLTTDSILYNKEGRIFINVVKSTSRAVTEKEKLGNLFQYCPEMILTKNKSNSIKSDVWSIGIILLDMLFDLETTQLNLFEFHPYNRSSTDLSEDDFIILDNIKQLYSKSFISRKTEDLGFRSDDISIKYDSLSQDCKDLIKKCLEMNKQHRGTIKMIKSHAFFSQVRQKE